MGGGPQSYRSVGYFVNWAIYGRDHQPQEVRGELLTHILYSFANLGQDGTVVLTDKWSDIEKRYPNDTWDDGGENNLYGCLRQLGIMKRDNRNLKVLLSIGGWTYSSNFAGPASTPEGRSTFARTSVEILKNYGFDGIDIDWEYPKDQQEARNYVALLAEVRKHLDAYSQQLETNKGHHFEMTVACPAGPTHFNNLDIRGMDQYLDFWNLMAYDFAGSWDGVSGHQANINPDKRNPASTPFSTTAALKHYIKSGVRPDKIVLGMPLYGRAFENTDGPGTPFQGVGEGTWEQGVIDYKKLPLTGSAVEYDESVGASWCYSQQQRKMVTYDTPQMAKAKSAFIRDQGLGGAMWWETSSDKLGKESLIATVVEGLGGQGNLLQQKNCLEYPQTAFDNLRNKFPKDKTTSPPRGTN